MLINTPYHPHPFPPVYSSSLSPFSLLLTTTTFYKMPLTITRFAPESLSSAEVTKSLTTDRPSTSYKLEYFDVSSMGAVSRDILSFGGAQWEDLTVTVRLPFRLSSFFHHELINRIQPVTYLPALLFLISSSSLELAGRGQIAIRTIPNPVHQDRRRKGYLFNRNECD